MSASRPAPFNPKSALEAVLLVAPGPATLQGLAEAIGVGADEAGSLMAELKDEYDREGRGFEIQAVAGGYRLVTRPEFAEAVNRYMKAPPPPTLSMAALETLAVIAYRQPVTRVEVEAIRGVRIDKALSTLVERGLVRELGRREGIGRPILYGTTPLFLEHFGLSSLGDLPALEEVVGEERPGIGPGGEQEGPS